MKKPKVFLTAAIILLMVLTGLVGCTFSGALDGPTGTTPDNTQPTTVPNTTTVPGMTTIPLTTTVPKADVATIQKLFAYREGERNPYYFALDCEFSNPKEIKLYDFFRGGWGPGTATDAEREELKQYYNESWLERAKIYRFPKERMNGELQKYFGISLADLPDTAFRYLTYLESSDCYCYVGTDSNVYVRNYTVESVENQDDGTVKVEYTSSTSTVGKHVVILKPNGRDFRVISNKWFVFDDPEWTFFNGLFQSPSMSDEVTRNYYNYALGQEYASPMELDLREFFGNGFRSEQAVTQAELTELKQYIDPLWVDNADCFRLPKDKMEADLQKCFGISLADLPETAFSGLTYLASTDCYYFLATSVHGIAERFEIKGVAHQDDGTVKVIYRKATYPEWDLVVTLLPKENGYQVLSNTYLPGITEDPEVMRYMDNAFLDEGSFANDPAKAQSMEFHDDNRISVRYIKESTGQKGTLILKPHGVTMTIISNTPDS